MRQTLINKICANKFHISVLIDESTNLNRLSCLVVYVRATVDIDVGSGAANGGAQGARAPSETVKKISQPDVPPYSRSSAKICWHDQFWRSQRSSGLIQVRSGSGECNRRRIWTLEAEVDSCRDVRPSIDCCWSHGAVRHATVPADPYPAAAVPDSATDVGHRWALFLHHATAEVLSVKHYGTVAPERSGSDDH